MKSDSNIDYTFDQNEGDNDHFEIISRQPVSFYKADKELALKAAKESLIRLNKVHKMTATG